MFKYIVLVIIGIVFFLFSDAIDKASNGQQQLKKVIRVFSVGVILICMIAMTALAFG